MIESFTIWAKAHWLQLGILSIVVLIVTLIISMVSVWILIMSLPPDYFTREKYVSRIKNPIARVLVGILKNIAGLCAILAGIVMLIGPGQGVLTIFVGIILCDFPGKRKLERKLIGRPALLSLINRLRIRYNRPPVVAEDES